MSWKRVFLGAMLWALGSLSAFAQNQSFYWKDSYGRGVGTIPPLECPAGKMQVGALCYDACRAGYNASGLQCVQSGCPAGYSDRGLTCHYDGEAVYSPVRWDGCATKIFGQCVGGFKEDSCRSGYKKSASMCYYTYMPPGMSGSPLDPMKASYSLGTPMAMQQVCRGGKQLDAGLCYDACRSGFNGVGPVCWANKPPGFEDCGFGFARSASACAAKIASQTAAVGSLVMAFIPTSTAATKAEASSKAASQSPDFAKAAAQAAPDLVKSLTAHGDEMARLAKEAADLAHDHAGRQDHERAGREGVAPVCVGRQCRQFLSQPASEHVGG